jgi:hypothetical protein
MDQHGGAHFHSWDGVRHPTGRCQRRRFLRHHISNDPQPDYRPIGAGAGNHRIGARTNSHGIDVQLVTDATTSHSESMRLELGNRMDPPQQAGHLSLLRKRRKNVGHHTTGPAKSTGSNERREPEHDRTRNHANHLPQGRKRHPKMCLWRQTDSLRRDMRPWHTTNFRSTLHNGESDCSQGRRGRIWQALVPYGLPRQIKTRQGPALQLVAQKLPQNHGQPTRL